MIASHFSTLRIIVSIHENYSRGAARGKGPSVEADSQATSSAVLVVIAASYSKMSGQSLDGFLVMLNSWV
jgi:hypothetical protein